MSVTTETPLRVYLIVGEPSGDQLGQRLMHMLKAATAGNVEFLGIGGPGMTAEGMTSLFPMSELTVMGVAEVLPSLRLILRRIRETADDIKAKEPDVVVSIDAPDFSLRVQKKIAGIRATRVHYVAPSVWAWRAGRAKKIAATVDHLLCLLPFEPPYFECEGLPATFVGHSILESQANTPDKAAAMNALSVNEAQKTICVLPGSRMSEVSRLLPVFEETIAHVRRNFGDVNVVIPTVSNVAVAVRAGVAHWPNTQVVDGNHAKLNAFAAADVALAASGTVTLELAMAGVPMVVAYKLHALTAIAAKRLLKVKYASIVNLLLDKEAIPECLQENCQSDIIADKLLLLLADKHVRAQQVSDCKAALTSLRADDMAPSAKAAQTVINCVRK